VAHPIEFQTAAQSFDSRRLQRVVNSALWAAAGDALGWISELTDQRGIRRRTGGDVVKAPTEWRRRIGGKFGPTVLLPPGTYSDDTQLRLAVCRATRGSGDFDVEAFGKIELTTWPCYALGAGSGTMGAASNLARGSVAWFSNFHGRGKRSGYFASGGNGAAMRIQPHVWKSKPAKGSPFLADVLRDAIVSHGHPTGFCGAVFHALCLEYALNERDVPGPNAWREFAMRLRDISRVVRQDSNLDMFWRGAWEEGAGGTLEDAIEQVISDYESLFSCISRNLAQEPLAAYQKTVEAVGGFDEKTRGSAVGTSLSAVVLAWLYREQSNETALGLAANTLNSDTDTIASMTGAIIGAAQPQPLRWPIQDRDYIEREAHRMAMIASGAKASTHSYPDLLQWEPPSSQSDVVGLFGEGIAVAGLGPAIPVGDVWTSGEAQWQWLKLDFGQTVLAKRRLKLRRTPPNNMPMKRTSQPDLPRENPTRNRERDMAQRDLPLPGVLKEQPDSHSQTSAPEREEYRSNAGVADLDGLTDWVIRSDFDPNVLGRAMLNCINSSKDLHVERAVAFASILAKAILARKRRQGSR
jgi:ADP-ribosylglycohydrolase